MENEKSAIRQSGLNLVHPLADREQITVQLTVVEKPQFDGDCLPTPPHTAW